MENSFQTSTFLISNFCYIYIFTKITDGILFLIIIIIINGLLFKVTKLHGSPGAELHQNLQFVCIRIGVYINNSTFNKIAYNHLEFIRLIIIRNCTVSVSFVFQLRY